MHWEVKSQWRPLVMVLGEPGGEFVAKRASQPEEGAIAMSIALVFSVCFAAL